MTNTATLNTSNKNTNNCGKLKYVLRTNKQTNKNPKNPKQKTNKLLLAKTPQHANHAK